MTDKKKKLETPRDLRKKYKRIKESRDALKETSKKKAADIKKLRGSIDDLKESRNSWKTQYQQAVETGSGLAFETGSIVGFCR